MVGYAVRLLEVYLIDYCALAGVKLSHVHFYLGSIDDFFVYGMDKIVVCLQDSGEVFSFWFRCQECSKCGRRFVNSSYLGNIYATLVILKCGGCLLSSFLILAA